MPGGKNPVSKIALEREKKKSGEFMDKLLENHQGSDINECNKKVNQASER